MSPEFKRIFQMVRDNDVRKLTGFLSRHYHIKKLLVNRYNTTKVSNIIQRIKFKDRLKTICPKCGYPFLQCKCKTKFRSLAKYISFKSLLKWIKRKYELGNLDEVLINTAIGRLKKCNIPDGLTKRDYILWKAGIINIDKCQCGRLKPTTEKMCTICKSIKGMNQTIKEKYGVNNISQRLELKEKRSKELKDPKVQQKLRQNLFNKYGVNNINEIPEFREKKSNSLKEFRLDFNNYIKLMNENYNKFGRFNARWEIPKDVKVKLINSKNPYLDYLRIIYNNKLKVDERCKLLTKFEDFAKSKNPRVVKVKCKECGRISSFSLWQAKADVYLSCKYCNAYTSVAERQLFNWIRNLGFKPLMHYNRGTKKGELDIFIPELKLGIEYQGLIWHAAEDTFKRDQRKWCTYTNEKIKIFYIYEDDYNLKLHIIKSMLLHKLRIKDKQSIVYARKCNINIYTKVTKKIKEFFNENHIHGFVSGQYYAVLTYKDIIVSGMIFSKHRFSKQDAFEITRFCTKTGYHIPGAFSKLYKHLYQYTKPNQVLFYIDTAFGSNLKDDIIKRYNYLDIKNISLIQPSFYVINLNEPYKKYNRLALSKSNLVRYIHEDIDISKYTQDELAELAGFGKVFRSPSWRIMLK